MRYRRVTSLVLILLLAVSTALAQTGDWQDVENLPPGAHISVQLRRVPLHQTCYLERATDSELVCWQTSGRPLQSPISSKLTFERQSIHEVRLEHSDAANGVIGGAIGAGAGVILGASTGSDSGGRKAGMFLFGILGFALGSAINKQIPISHGRVIYRR
jgi:hypothetical protein